MKHQEIMYLLDNGTTQPSKLRTKKNECKKVIMLVKLKCRVFKSNAKLQC